MLKTILNFVMVFAKHLAIFWNGLSTAMPRLLMIPFHFFIFPLFICVHPAFIFAHWTNSVLLCISGLFD
jgi:hypothetical protein